MKIEVKVPSVGESVTTADIESWEKKQGDLVKKGEVLVILETDKASMEIPAEQDGRLEILKSKGEQVSVDEVIAFIETSAGESKEVKDSRFHGNDGNRGSDDRASSSSVIPSKAVIPEKAGIHPSKFIFSHSNENALSQSKQALEDFSPAVRQILSSKKINPEEVKGTGRGGRLTKEDLLNYLDSNSTPADSLKKNSSGLSKNQYGNQSKNQESSSFQSSSSGGALKPDQRREPMTRLRRVTAERLVQSQHQTATLTTFNEVDLSRIIEIRKNYQEDFIKKYGFKLGFMSFFVKAVVVALKEFPKINAFIEGEDIIYNDSQHIGIAVSTEKGLVVPVLFHAERMTLAQIEKKIIEYRDKALSRKLSPDDLLGGTFTISNGGVFGSLLSTPILNPPQSGILGMHKIEQRPVVREGQIEIRPMMYLALSYDHRMVDGRESVSFLVKVREGLEEPSRLLIDI